MYKVRIGCINAHDTEDLDKAIDIFESYVDESKGKNPLYQGKPVLLIENDKTILKYKRGGI